MPEIGLNLLSLCLLRKKGVSITIGPQNASLYINGKQIIKGFYHENLIIISTKPSRTPLSESAYISTTSDLWHERMGHIGANALKRLPEKAIGCEIDPKTVENTSKCEVCI